MDFERWALFFTALAALIGPYLSYRAAVSKGRVDREGQIDAKIQEFVRTQAEEIKNLQARVRILERQLRLWVEGALLLYRQLIQAGIAPAWTPPEDSPWPADSTDASTK